MIPGKDPTPAKHQATEAHLTIKFQCAGCKRTFEHDSPNIFDEKAMENFDSESCTCPHCGCRAEMDGPALA
jgi:hypothetical protein